MAAFYVLTDPTGGPSADFSPVKWSISCCRASDHQGDVFLRFELGGVYGLGIQVKCGRHFGVAQQSLNRLHVLALANQKRRKAMTKIMESESLTRLQSDADLEGGGRILSAVIMLALIGVLPFSFKDGNIQSSDLVYGLFWFQSRRASARRSPRGTGAAEPSVFNCSTISFPTQTRRR